MKKRSKKKSGLKYPRRRYVWAVLRIFIGLIFLWAFFDKTFGLGFATNLENAWINGGSPTTGFLAHATNGFFAPFFQSLAGSALVDWLFMLGLLGIGVALTFGILVRIGSLSGIALLFLMWLAVLPPKNNPFLDDHIIYIVILVGLLIVHAGKALGLGSWWRRLDFVKRNKWLE